MHKMNKSGTVRHILEWLSIKLLLAMGSKSINSFLKAKRHKLPSDDRKATYSRTTSYSIRLAEYERSL